MTEHQPTPEQPLTQRNRLLAKIALDGWNNQTSGDVSRVSITPAELPEIRAVFEDDIYDSELADTSSLVGHFLVEITVTEYPTEAAVVMAYEERLK